MGGRHDDRISWRDNRLVDAGLRKCVDRTLRTVGLLFAKGALRVKE